MGTTYQDAGVDITAGDEAVQRMKHHVKKTFRPEVLTDLGSFAGLFALDIDKYHQPVLVSGTDGVGTKLKIAMITDRHDTIGIDAVAMCVNDILVQGAEPLFFLDYLAVGKLNPPKVEEIVKGVAAGCLQAGCALIGGETAEMPGFYAEDEYDIAGFAVGVVNKDKIINGSAIVPGDVIIGLPSSGLHSNGFSLARKVLLELAALKMDEFIPELDCTLGEAMLKPTRIYVQDMLPLIAKYEIKGMAHITGGGLTENLPRVFPEGVQADIDLTTWETPPVFRLIQKLGQVTEEEMFRVFNMGVGYCIICDPSQVSGILADCAGAFIMGKITAGDGKVHFTVREK
ncbi:phosphoribosylformylglycinamidine cyclo-ligase [Dehalobacterium formicoaceticum]|uniref:Phosphoribosylformylglycinamidine cyclo-ligase n=1 Tax=Dehalobacterium formicoaceticum TaxID=51515 RepID=A0ABT1Y4X9_9FIRM|nr:phosphoribosylformylglycinamidine cyclo-ligase [Dehalobacterium formicoaceticum]MCR6544736.1 phosphoribosylformylglycinamidine cyclo-ligase [Dehalobacterium formicoaceticum]